MSIASMIAILTVISHEIGLRRELMDSKRWQTAQKAIDTAIVILKGDC